MGWQRRAAGDLNPARRQRALTFAIVGGGPTGVKFAGALAELIRGPLRKDYPMLNFGDVRVVLLEAVSRGADFPKAKQRQTA